MAGFFFDLRDHGVEFPHEPRMMPRGEGGDQSSLVADNPSFPGILVEPRPHESLISR